MVDVSKKKTYIVDIYHYILEINTSNSYKKFTVQQLEINIRAIHEIDISYHTKFD